jgi:DNA methyltransferase 1-associated protein 1
LTASEIAEEEALFIEVKRMEQNGKRFRAERDDLMRNVVGFDSGLYNVDQSTLDTILGADKVN